MAGAAGATSGASGAGQGGSSSAGASGTAGGTVQCLPRADAKGADPKVGFDKPTISVLPEAGAWIAQGQLSATPFSPASTYSFLGQAVSASAGKNVVAARRMLDTSLMLTGDPPYVWSGSSAATRVDGPYPRLGGTFWVFTPNDGWPASYTNGTLTETASMGQSVVAWDGVQSGSAVASLQNPNDLSLPKMAGAVSQLWVAGELPPSFKSPAGIGGCQAVVGSIRVTPSVSVGGRCLFTKGNGVVRAVMGLDDDGALLLVEPTGTGMFDLGTGEYAVNGHLWGVRLDSARNAVNVVDLQLQELISFWPGEFNAAWISARAVGNLPTDIFDLKAPPCADREFVVARLNPTPAMTFSYAMSYGVPVSVLAASGQNETLVAYSGFGSGVSFADNLSNAAPTMVGKVHPGGALLWIQTANTSGGLSFLTGAVSASATHWAAIAKVDTPTMLGNTQLPIGSAYLLFPP